MDKRDDRLGINLFILSIAMILLLYITYSLRNYYDYSLKADNNPSIKTDDAAPELAPHKGGENVAGVNLATLSAEGSEQRNIHEEQNIEIDNNDIDNADIDIKGTDTKEIEVTEETRSEAETETIVGGTERGETEIVTMVKEPKQEETETETMVEKLKQEETEFKPEKLQTMGIVSREITTSGSKSQKDVNLDETLNKYVLDTIKTYKVGNYPYLLNNDYQNYNGVTENLYYNGELLLKANPNGNRACHCTGITFEVFFKAMQNRNRDLEIDIDNFNGMNKEELYDFALTWYVAKGSEDISNVALAMEKYGVGKRIHSMEELRAGDFINWIREEDRIVGFRYWSSQGSTDGINYKEEYFNIKRKDGNKYGNVMIDNFYMGRISSVSEYKGFK